MADDDLLSPQEIEALLNSAGLGRPSGSAPAAPPAKAASVAKTPPSAFSSTDRLIDQAEADLRAAVAPILNPSAGLPKEFGRPAAFDFPALPASRPAAGANLPLDALQEVELDLRVELGRTELLIDEVMKLREGSVVPLDKLAGDPVDILVNGKLIARGEVLVLNDNFCVRVAEIFTPES